MEFLIKNKAVLFGVLIGGILGYIYFHFIGCANGTCMITSKPINSTLYGAVMGGLLLRSFKN